MNKYPLNSAGRKMVKNVPVCHKENSVLDVKNMLFKTMNLLETINYVYVVDKQRKLIGVFSIKDIFRRPNNKKVKDITEKEVIRVKPHTDQERVAILALQNNIKSVPVVDKNNKFLGVVPSDIILDILNSENIEDFLKMAGINSPLQKLLKGSAFYLAKVRIPWLILGLFGGIFAAGIIDFFEAPLKSYFILTAFIPLMLYLASAVGAQTETLFIRNLVLDSKLSVWKYLFREIRVSLLISFILSVLLYLIALFFFKSEYFIGIILGASLFLTILMAALIGISIPWILTKLKKDPAVGTGPFATILRDVLSLVIYFLIATFLLSIFTL